MSDHRFDDDLSWTQIAIRIGQAFALTAVIAVSVFFLILFFAGPG